MSKYRAVFSTVSNIYDVAVWNIKTLAKHSILDL